MNNWTQAECDRLVPIVVDAVESVCQAAMQELPDKGSDAAVVALVLLDRAVKHAMSLRSCAA